MADNTKQFVWIVMLFGNIAALFRDRDDVFVSGNQNWYPVEGHPEIVQAPDVYVVFGRPKGHRPSYKQWEEGGLAMTVVFEVLSPKNTVTEMADKFAFYEEYGVEEYYIYDPDNNRLQVFTRRGDVLVRIRQVNGFVSPRLGIRFQMTQPEMTVYHPNGEPFRSFEEVNAVREQEKARADKAEEARKEAEEARKEAEERAERAEVELERLRRLLGQSGEPT